MTVRTGPAANTPPRRSLAEPETLIALQLERRVATGELVVLAPERVLVELDRQRVGALETVSNSEAECAPPACALPIARQVE